MRLSKISVNVTKPDFSMLTTEQITFAKHQIEKTLGDHIKK